MLYFMGLGSSTQVLQERNALILLYLEARYDAGDSKLKVLLGDADLSACDQMDGLPDETIQLHQVHGGVHRVRCTLVLQPACHIIRLLGAARPFPLLMIPCHGKRHAYHISI